MIENDTVALKELNGSRDEFISGVDDEELCYMYGLKYPVDADRLFRRFCGLSTAYGVFRKSDGRLTGFIICVEPEISEALRNSLSSAGKTLAYATFPPYQRQGYMYSALTALTEHLFTHEQIGYIHCGRFSYNIKSAELLKKLGFAVSGSHPFGDKEIIDNILLRHGD